MIKRLQHAAARAPLWTILLLALYGFYQMVQYQYGWYEWMSVLVMSTPVTLAIAYVGLFLYGLPVVYLLIRFSVANVLTVLIAALLPATLIGVIDGDYRHWWVISMVSVWVAAAFWLHLTGFTFRYRPTKPRT